MAVHLSVGRKLSTASLAVLGFALVIGSAPYMIAPDPVVATAPGPRAAAVTPEPTSTEDRTVEIAQAGAEPAPIAEQPPEKTTQNTPAVPPIEPAVQTAALPPAALAPPAPAESLTEPLAAAAAASQPVEVQPTEAPPVVAEPVVTQPAKAEPTTPPAKAQLAAFQVGVTVARLMTEPRDSAGPAARRNKMAPIPVRAPRPADAGALAAGARSKFERGVAIKVKRDAKVYITARNIPRNDRLLEAYSAERSNGGRVQTKAGEAAAVPGLLGIAAQAQRAHGGGKTYSLADAMRDAVWRKKTAERLKSLTTVQNSCAGRAGGTAKIAPSIGLPTGC